MSKKRECTLKVPNQKEALEQAQEILASPPTNIDIKEVSKGEFKASLVNVDAEIEVSISEEKMTATITKVSPKLGKGKELSLELLTASAEKAGVRVDLEKKALAEFLKSLETDTTISNLVIARGKNVTPGKDSHIEPLGNMSYPVFPGDTVAKKHPPIPPVEGVQVDGTVIHPDESSQAKDLTINDGEEFKVGEDGINIIAKVYGLVKIENNQLSTTPLLIISPDNMCAKMNVYPLDFKGNEVTAEKLMNVISKEGIKPLNSLEQSLESSIKKISLKESLFEEVVVALGISPQNGTNGFLDLICKDKSGDEEEKKDEEQKADLEESGEPLCVKQGDLIGRILPPVKGFAGTDIFGKPIPCPTVHPCHIEKDENVIASEDGNKFYAGAEGMVVYSNNTLAVLNIFEVDGDVDNKTGNIDFSEGSVLIKGSVREGFSVACPGNIIVEGSVEGAFLAAGGSVNVSKGITMAEKGEIKAGGDVSAEFATSASIVAGRDVRIASSLVNCEVFAERKVIVTEGNGKIRGGRIHSGSCIEANEVGSDTGAPTLLAINVLSQSYRENIEIQKDLKLKISKILEAFGNQDLEELINILPQEKADKIRSLQNSLNLFKQSLEKINELINLERDSFWESQQKEIIIHTMLYQDTSIRIGGDHFLKVRTPEPKCFVSFNSLKNEIEISPLLE